MITSVFNNKDGGGKSTLLYSLLIYLKGKGKNVDLNLYDLYNDSALFLNNDALKDLYNGIENYTSLNKGDDLDIYNKFADFYSDRHLHFFNTVGEVNNSHSMILLYSKAILVPVIPTYYYLNNISALIDLVNSIYKNVFIPNEKIGAVVKEFPTFIFVPMFTEISKEIKERLLSLDYGKGESKRYFVEEVFPFIDYKEIINYTSNNNQIDYVNESISKLLFSL